MSDREEGRQQGAKARRTSLELAGQQIDAGRWAQGINGVDVEASSTRDGLSEDVSMTSPTSFVAERRRSSTSAAALLMAANTLAQTPAQDVSDALLEEVQKAAAIEQTRRRSSIPTPVPNDVSQQISSPSLDQQILTPPSIDVQLAGQPSSSSPFISTANINRDLDPNSSSTANLQVGNIATAVAAREYVEQDELLAAGWPSIDSNRTPTQETYSSAFAFGESSSKMERRWDDKNPFQGVPSLPLTPTASLAMLPPPNVTTAMPTPLTPKGIARLYPFRPTYHLAASEYQILASAAAIATVALTTAAIDSTPSSKGIDERNKTPSAFSNGHITPTSQERRGRFLTRKEQEEIAYTLRAWAGLEGAERQEEARRILEDRQQQIKDATHTEGNVQFFPPDFARHFKSQLTALAAGYYQQLHSDGLTGPQFATEQTGKDERVEGGTSRPIAIWDSSRPASLSSSIDLFEKDFEHRHKRPMETSKEAEGMTTARKDARNPISIQGSEAASSQDETSSTPPTPVDPMQFVTCASNASGLDVKSPEIRDHLLQYAHNLYSTGHTSVSNGTAKDSIKGTEATQRQIHPTLLPLLHTLHNLHPTHLPTLLLLSCAYYSSGDLAASLWYNKQILQIDGNYVESMSNIGTTLRALGRSREAESWWWKAIRLRPGYWDAYENLLGVLCSPNHGDTGPAASSDHRQDTSAEEKAPRFADALRLCEFVESHILAKRQGEQDEALARKVASGRDRPVCMPSTLPLSQISRLQNLLYAKGNLKYVLAEYGPIGAAKEYEKAVEMMLSSSKSSAYSLRDLVMATYVVGVLTFGVDLPEAKGSNATAEIAQALGLDPTNSHHGQLAAAGQYSSLSSGGVLRLVRDAGDALLNTFLRFAGGRLPTLMVLPESAIRLCAIIFADSQGALPAIISTYHAHKASISNNTLKQVLQQTSLTTSTVILTLSKLFQDSTGAVEAGSQRKLTLGGIPTSTSLLLPFYYLSLALNPSASTANNLGILLSSIPTVANVVNSSGQRQLMNGQSMALQYYTYGLRLDPKHPHLYTNFGSLLKDLNRLQEAIQLYERAIECNPEFDVALANIGNAIKDQGRTQDSVPYYRRAVKVNPDFPEALCGLVNALLAVCEWKEVYGEDDLQGESGYMKRIRTLVDKQLDEGGMYGRRALAAEGTLDRWINTVERTSGEMREGYREELKQQLSIFYDDTYDRKANKINEGSFIIRLIERLTKHTQRKWYHDVYTKGNSTTKIIVQESDIKNYPRIPLPSCLVTPTVPTVLPFHTFTLKLSPRQIRLISHRNALRISQSTMAQLWLPRHVYPPPIPPNPKIKVGYISSDFNNHPLAHLMQSVFGFHNRDEFDVHLYATTASDQSPYRHKIEKEAHHFIDVSTWSNPDIIKKILEDGIHILMNLNGYTKGAKNEIFAARPCPVQMEFMGFAGGLASGWTDWIVADPIVCPPEMTSTDVWRANKDKMKPTDWRGSLDPEDESNNWIYTEKFIYMPDSYFVNDHRQGFREPNERQSIDGTEMVKPHEMSEEEAWKEEEERRWKARKEMWPDLPDDYFIFSDFNQLYKLEPSLFKLWLRVLQKVPNSILWLLKFPAAGEFNLLNFAKEFFGEEIASRVIFTEVAPKGIHIHRGRIADLFLDTWECGAHTTSADILWSATPVLTWPRHKHKMASRVAASIVSATWYGKEMVVDSEEAYEQRAIEWARGLRYDYVDADGNVIPPQKVSGTIKADALEVDSQSTPAMPHNKAGQSSAAGLTSSQIPGLAANPAPTSVKRAAAESVTSTTANNDGTQSASTTTASIQRKEITLTYTGEKAPQGAISRRAHGPLAELRKKLFLSRDTNKLFDTKLWVKNLERGYKEAWKRYVDGTDVEDSMEWQALPEDDVRKKSGHIWL